LRDATQYSSNYKRHDTSVTQKVHYVGNSLKAMHLSVAASLKKLRTTYIDILYVHWCVFLSIYLKFCLYVPLY
jgi:diketogulonate reductase-like aldo/keto reductase